MILTIALVAVFFLSWKLDGGTASTVHKNRIDVGESCMYAKIATVWVTGSTFYS